MGVCVDKLAHPACGASNALQVFQQEDGSVDGFCFKCGEQVADPYGDGEIPEYKVKSPEEREAEVREVVQYPCVALPQRKLKLETLKYYGCRMEMSGVDGVTPVATYFMYGIEGKLNGWKVATLGETKKQWAIGNTKGCDFFGWGRAIRSGSRTLIITEGEYDAMALRQVLKDANAGTQWADQEPAVVSLVHGVTSALKGIARHKDRIDQYFDEVILAFDMDGAGQETAAKVCRRYPMYKIATLPCKDANACLMEGASKALKKAVIFQAAKPKNSRLVMGSALREAACKEAEMGLSWPWQGLTDATRGIRRGETIYLGAGVKMGKSELVNAIGEHMITEHKTPVMFCKPEEALPKSYKMLVGKAAGRIFHDPNIPFDHAAFDKAEALIGDMAIFSDVYQFLNWDQLKDDLIYARHELEIADFIIDPITCFTNQMSSSEANEHLTMIAADISAMAKDNEFTAYLFCHLKSPGDNKTPHERGGKVLSSQFAGSRAMMRSCNYMIGMEGNKDPDLEPEQRNLRDLVILEDREFGNSDRIPLYWDKHTGVFNELR